MCYNKLKSQGAKKRCAAVRRGRKGLTKFAFFVIFLLSNTVEGPFIFLDYQILPSSPHLSD